MTPERFAALYWLVAAIALAWLLHLLDPVLTPFLAAGILAYILQPLVARSAGWRYMSRTSATGLVMLLLLVSLVTLLLILLPLLRYESGLLMAKLPELLDIVRQRLLPLLEQYFGVAAQWDATTFKELLSEHWQSAGGVSGKVLPWLGSSGLTLINLLLNLLLIPLVMFYLLRDWPLLLQRIDESIPRRWHDKTREIAGEVDAVLAEFLRGQLSVMVLMSLFYAIALALTGMQFALPIGIVSGMLVFVPYLGAVIGLVLATLVAVTHFDSYIGVLVVWGIFAAGQMLEGMVVTPKLVGDRIGLHPLGVIFALLAFGQLFGFFGVLLALPISAMLLVGLRHFRGWYLTSPFYKN
ncbi:MAG: AI-2E family transporter [Gammaproteobacteria bacterium]|nr:AI-2E family transporter [Gammaproteobacteria bacterium]MBU1776314.1 AI-2E family transporter [Gammaproteobacteria bacterium]MBU1969056.1 AI-2E family transporter [Gammaproteobacteria bacterium]